MEKSNFELAADEAALIFKKDMSIEIVIPNMKDEETVDFEENQNMFVAMAIAASSDSPLFRQVIGEKLEEMLGGSGGVEDPHDGGVDCDGCQGCSPILMETPPLGDDIPKSTCGPEDSSGEEC